MKNFKSLSLFTLALALGSGAAMAAKPQVVAHRGHWTPEGSAQNSVRSLVKADSIKCDASEFDVWSTVDGVIVVNHDPTVNGIKIEKAHSLDVTRQHLANGELLPTMEQLMTVAEKLDTRLVCELKTHKDRQLEAKAVETIIAMIDKHGLNDRVDYITFSKEGMLDLIRLAPKGTPVYFLTSKLTVEDGAMSPKQLKEAGAAGMDYETKTLRKNPGWIKECHDLGMKVNVWTVNSPEDIQWCIDHGVDYITTNDPELVQSMINK